MSALIDDLLELSRLTRATLESSTVDVSTLARETAAELHARDPGRDVSVRVADGLTARPRATIEIGRREDGQRAFAAASRRVGYPARRC